MKPKLWLTALVFVLAGSLLFFRILPHAVDRSRNRVLGSAGAEIPSLHHELRIVDLHADTLLWDRPLLERGTRGHVDLVRLQEGNVSLQVFSVVTKSPRWLSYESNSADEGDNISLLALAQRWPFRTWSSLLERALYQAERLREAAAGSGGTLRLIRSREDLAKILADRRGNPALTGALLALEGSHALEGRVENLRLLRDAGFRVLAPTHMFDSDWAGSQQGEKRGGLTPLGRDWVREMERLGLIIDLAHASSAAIEDILEISKRPLIVSHTGAEKICPNNRNLSDDQIRRVAGGGGLIGAGLWSGATCGEDLASVARTLRHLINVGGLESVALGSDWDGFVSTPVDAARLGALTAKLNEENFTETEIRALMGENAIRFFLRHLPSRSETNSIE